MQAWGLNLYHSLAEGLVRALHHSGLAPLFMSVVNSWSQRSLSALGLLFKYKYLKASG